MRRKNDGLIPEFERHLGTIVMYPVRDDIWRDDARYMQEYVFELVNIIAKHERVFFFALRQAYNELKDKYANTANVEVILAEYDDIWARDIAPSFVRKDGKVECIDWKFNAWGGKKEGSYYPWEMDDSFASVVANHFGLDCRRAPIVVEGGGIVTDGAGTLFTTRSVLLNRNRNPFKSKETIEAYLSAFTGLRRVIWLDGGLSLDETNGHIDNIVSFISPKELCMAWTEDKSDRNYNRLSKAYQTLCGLKNLRGEEYIIHKIPLPEEQYRDNEEAMGLGKGDSLERKEGDLLPASYLNYYLINGAVIVPVFGCEKDREVLDLFEEIFTDREIIPIYSREPLLGGGGIHCILHEVPEL